MRPLGHKRQLALFLGAILVPCAALAVLSLQIINQDRQLAEKRRADERRQMLERARNALLTRLERLKAVAAADSRGQPAVALVAAVRDGKLVLPWETDAAKARERLADPRFQAAVQQGEREEFAGGDHERAARAYQAAIGAARYPEQAAYARSLWARALAKTGRSKEAAAQFRLILADPAEAADEDGVPLELHAAEGLLGAEPGADVLPAVRRLAARSWLSPVACYALSGMAEKLAQAAHDDAGRLAALKLQQNAAARIRAAAQAEALQNDFQKLGPFETAAGPVWALYGDDPWLVSAAARGADRAPVVVAVHAKDVLESVGAERAVRFHSLQEAGGELLAPGFTGLKAELLGPETSPGFDARRLQYLVYGAALLLLVGAAAFGATLLWKDLAWEMKLSEVRSQFVSSVTHELKTPLTAIRMFAETLQMGRSQDPAVQSEYLDTIVSECERLSRLVDDVLLFSKMEQGKKTYRFRPTPLDEAVRAAARTLEYPLRQGGFKLDVHVDETVPALMADRDALEQAILNLLTNAMKYSGDARDIQLDLSRQNGDAVIRVTDHGLGIAPEEHARIFEKFYRAPTPENQSIPGTGLGLTLVSQIAKAHSGRVELLSAPGMGSTFSIRLPLERKA